MTPRNQLDIYFNWYAAHHLNPVNKLIHWFCVPLIMYSILGMVWSIPMPKLLSFNGSFNWTSLLMAIVIYYWYTLSHSLAYAMILVYAGMNYLIVMLNGLLLYRHINPVIAYLFIFILAWTGQFIGHKIEGKKPSFMEDLKFLLIGPLWLLHFIFVKLGITY